MDGDPIHGTLHILVYVGLRTYPQQLIHYDIGIHCSRQFSHVSSLFIQLFRHLFCQLSQLSPRQLRPPQLFVRLPDERVLKVDEEGRVRRLLTCSYASCFWKHREGETFSWDSEFEVDYLSLVFSQYIDLSSPLS